jgi:hypothetical protein
MVDLEHGRLIDAGFAAFAEAQGPLPPELAIDLRIAFFAGAQHMFSSMVRMSRTPSEKFTLKEIEGELNRFVDECILRGAPCAGSA